MVTFNTTPETETANDPNWALSMAAAIPSGVIKIVEGTATFGAALLDLGVESFLGVPFLSLDSHVALQLEEDKCFGSGQAGLTDGYGGSSGVHGESLYKTTGGVGSGCQAGDHSKATVSSFHVGGALTWSF